MIHRDMKKLDKSAFRYDLRNRLKEAGLSKYEHFKEIFENVLDKHGSKKKKIIRANEKPYVIKALRKAIMKRSELATKFRNRPTDDSKKAFKKQKKIFNRLYKKQRRKWYEKLDLQKITYNKKFRDTIKPFLSNKTSTSQKISLKRR